MIHSFLRQALVPSRLCASDGAMDGGTLIGRLDQIEAALDRIEAQAARIDPRRMAEPPALPDAELQDRHTALQASVRGALAQLDSLIDRDNRDREISA